MTDNPHPFTVIDPDTGQASPNQRYKDWQAGYEAGKKAFANILRPDLQARVLELLKDV